MAKHTEPASQRIGFIGQGFIGKNMADDFEQRGYDVVRYALEEPYIKNKATIAECDTVFIAVPTPTTPDGFSDTALRTVLPLVGSGNTVVIKSTVLPGTTESIQEEHPDKVVLFSPEFLSAATAAHDAAFPIMNIVGVPDESATYRDRAHLVLAMLPKSPHDQVCHARSAEIFKYVHNMHGVWRILFANLMYDLVEAHEPAVWEEIAKAMAADPYLTHQASYYNQPVHGSGRGAGGNCFIKDFAAFREGYQKHVPDDHSGIALLKAIENKNIDLLRSSGKDSDLLAHVYGTETMEDKR
jgi:UDP-glucose 6-dehydrogenase